MVSGASPAGPVSGGRLEALQTYRLLQSVHEGDQALIERLLATGVHDLINLAEPREGTCALHAASAANHADVAELLLARGARPDVRDKRGRTPVMLAAELGHDGVVAVLAKHHADMRLTDGAGRGVLFYCLCPTKRHMRCMQVALASAVDVNNVCSEGVPLFLKACENACDWEGMCLILLESGADPSATSQTTGRTALMEAVRCGATELVKAILKRGANLNAVDTKRLHAVHLAAQGGHFELIRMLSAYAADMGVTTTEGDTALHYAARGDFADCCRFLAQRGCNPKLKNLEGVTPRQIAKDLGYKASVRELKKAERLHGKISQGLGGKTEPWAITLHDWSHENEAELLKAFQSASYGLDDVETVSKETFLAVLRELQAPVEDENIQRVLLSHDKRREGVVNIREFFTGLRYLPRAFVMASYEPKKRKKTGVAGKPRKKIKANLPLPICTVPPELVRRRADGGPPHFMIESYQLVTDTRRFNRDHPPGHQIEDDSAWYMEEPEKTYLNISCCVRAGDTESLRLAFSRNVPVDVKDGFYKTPLMTACATGSYEVAEFLLELGADVNARDQFSWSPLHHACHAGQLDIIKLLVEAGASVDTPTLGGATPLMRAIESSRFCCVDYLLKAGATVTAKNKAGQSCMDVARAYADFRTVELIRTRIDSLPKPKARMKGRAGRPQPRVHPATFPSSKEKGAASTPHAEEAEMKVEASENSVVMCRTQITRGEPKKADISFTPRTVWWKHLTSSQLMEQKQRRRKQLGYEVDFDDLRMPFNKNIRKKIAELSLSSE
ncbi:ankyrin repeat and EF-hand domain-containing protein 1a [Electrophorus electricus]|uniref:ankyrin repeat and EF-hand domain-containing protein 1a n=1 Tax=Electrophorus electricus TaxID=8005 RepID=UPI0015CF960E|nr:ankyrin repeat and EF-hand domain-containing protein 1a [Electrophorus electricus]